MAEDRKAEIVKERRCLATATITIRPRVASLLEAASSQQEEDKIVKVLPLRLTMASKPLRIDSKDKGRLRLLLALAIHR